MSWLVSALVKPVLEFVFAKLALGISALTKFIIEYKKRKDIVDEKKKQADVVQAIADQIKQLMKEGKPVPPELEQRLLDESSKIIIGKPVNH